MVPRIKGSLPIKIKLLNSSHDYNIIFWFEIVSELWKAFLRHLMSVRDFSVCARSDRYLVGKYQYHHWLAGWLPSISDDRSFIYGRRLACVSCNRSAPTRMHSVAGEKRRNIGKWFWKVRLRQSSTAPGVIRNEIAWNRRDEYLVSRLRIHRLIGISAFQKRSNSFVELLVMLKSNIFLNIHRYRCSKTD